MIADSSQEVGAQHHHVNAPEVQQRSVGILSTSHTGLQEVACLLAHEAVGMSQGIRVDPRDLHSDAGGAEMLAGLRTLQNDPATEIVALLSETPAPGAAERVLAQVRESDKPTVVCFLGLDPRLLWQAGAIPAARLDETALRAAAWVRGWDQALISSMLEEEDDRLSMRARKLAQRLPSSRQRLTGLFTSKLFRQEAHFMLAEVAGDVPRELEVVLDREAQLHDLLHVYGDGKQAVILLDIVLGRDDDSASAQVVAGILPAHHHGPLVIAHICGGAEHPDAHKSHTDTLGNVGIVLTRSNAAAARLAGMVLERQRQAGAVPAAD